MTIIANASAVTGNSYLLGGINYKVVDDASIADEIAANNYNIVTTRVTNMSSLFENNAAQRACIKFRKIVNSHN